MNTLQTKNDRMADAYLGLEEPIRDLCFAAMTLQELVEATNFGATDGVRMVDGRFDPAGLEG